MRIILLLLFIWTINIFAGQFEKVKITPKMSYMYVYHKGKVVKIHRIQDTKHKLTGEYAKQYRPYKYIQPIKINEHIQTIGERELLSFMKHKGNSKKGIVLDLRSKKAYKKESIPSAVNFPIDIRENKAKMEKIFKIFGVNFFLDGSIDTSKAIDIVFYCHGLWCKRSVETIKIFLKLGYPAEKMLYYRGGFQMWKLLGFTTVSNQ